MGLRQQQQQKQLLKQENLTSNISALKKEPSGKFGSFVENINIKKFSEKIEKESDIMVDIFAVKPHQVSKDLKGYALMFYGEPKSGGQ